MKPKQNLHLLKDDQFPRSSKYSPELIVANSMGPHTLWLTEFLCEAMDLKPGMRILDLGCGKALSSIFLAQEFNVDVWATDLWITPTENAERINTAQLSEKVFPIYADARRLPFAEKFFDAIISIDAFEYFGTDGSFISSIVKYLKPGCQIGIVNAGLLEEIEALPEEWPSDFCTFHTPEWWRRLWTLSRCVTVEVADQLPNGRELWIKWNQAIGSEDDMYLTADAGKNLGIHRVVGSRIMKAN
jgi:cyclopropane fatty-acyl-phospholipid synthase-like methyltransferase